MDFSNKQVMLFAAMICGVCSLLISTLAVVLNPTIQDNKKLDKQRQVIRVAGLAEDGEELTKERVAELFKSVESKIVRRDNGEYIGAEVMTLLGLDVKEGEEEKVYDPIKAAKDPELSIETPDEADNGAQVARLPKYLALYEINEVGNESIVIPIYGKGLWSTMYGYLALSKDGKTVKGITFFEHGETPGLGGEIDNKKWQAAWVDLAVFEGGEVKLGAVKKGAARDEKYEVDGLSGATITTKGVDATVKLWLGEAAYGPYLTKRGN